MRVRKSIILISTLSLAACVTPSSESAPEDLSYSADIEGFATLYERQFETPPENETIIHDRRVRVTSSDLSGYWYYSQLNTGETGKVYRQRLSNITASDDGTALIQTSYGLNDPERFVDVWDKPELLETLTDADFTRYFDTGCEQVWQFDEARQGWVGYVDPQDCIISSQRRNKDIRIEAEAFLAPDIYQTTERGYEMDMTFLWGSQPGEFITLKPKP